MSRTCDRCKQATDGNLHYSPSDRNTHICPACYEQETGKKAITGNFLTRKLTFEFVPVPLWGNNLSHRMTRASWQKIRIETINAQGEVCGICGSNERPLECHERWEYDDENHIQTLTGFIALCRKCHAIKHYGRQEIIARKELLREATGQHTIPDRIELARLIAQKLNALREHYLTVNDVPNAIFVMDYRQARYLHARRSQFTDWTTDFREYAPFVTLPPGQYDHE